MFLLLSLKILLKAPRQESGTRGSVGFRTEPLVAEGRRGFGGFQPEQGEFPNFSIRDSRLQKGRTLKNQPLEIPGGENPGSSRSDASSAPTSGEAADLFPSKGWNSQGREKIK